MISRTFSTKSASVESLKVSVRCGCKPKAFQLPWIVAGATEAEPSCHPCFEFVRQRLRVSSIPADDHRRRRSRRRPKRHGDTSVVAGIIVLIGISGDICLQPHGAEVISNQPAGRELALFLVARDGSAQVHGPKSDRAQLPFVELLVAEERIKVFLQKFGPEAQLTSGTLK
jgi:hypothetical protein